MEHQDEQESQSQQRNPHRRAFFAVLLIFLATRCALWATAAHVSATFPMEAKIVYGRVAPEQPWLDPWLRWDALYYLEIAEGGYERSPGKRSNAAFFPVYPALVSTFAKLTGSIPVAALLVSNLAFLGALWLLYRLAEKETGDAATALRSVLYLCLFPSSFVAAAPYTEGVFLLTAVGAFYAMRCQRWDWATACAIFASATRPQGIVVAAVVFLGKPSWKTVLAPAGLACVMFYHGLTLGRLSAFMEAQGAWGRGAGNLFHTVSYAFNRLVFQWPYVPGIYPYELLVNLVTFMAMLVLCAGVAKRFGAAYGVYAALQVLIPASTGILASIVRYSLTAFPVFLLLAEWGRKKAVDQAVIAIFCCLQALFLTMWTSWYFIF